jgi:hypothetical protein
MNRLYIGAGVMATLALVKEVATIYSTSKGRIYIALSQAIESGATTLVERFTDDEVIDDISYKYYGESSGDIFKRCLYDTSKCAFYLHPWYRVTLEIDEKEEEDGFNTWLHKDKTYVGTFTIKQRF